jgi:hypothetical protein
VWTSSVHETIHAVLGPLARAGAFTPAAVWAVGALVLPWLVRGRSVAGDAMRVGAWAAAVALGTAAAIGHGGLVSPGAVVLGAAASGIVALAPTVRTASRPRGESVGPPSRVS